MSSSKVGMESRSDVLPVVKTNEGPGIFGPDYDFGDNMPTPAEIGVSSGGSLDHVLDAVRAVSWYTDMIGFGAATNGLSRGVMGGYVQPYALGVNYFVNTGQKCPNGEDMYMYVHGIPKGDMLGPRITKAIGQMGLPPLRGLGPGAIEDAEHALDPRPILGAVFGSGYPDCEEVTRSVGDQSGRIQNPETKNYYVDKPETVKNGNQQTHWIQKLDAKDRPVWLTKEEYDSRSKCSDGSLIAEHIGRDCSNDLTNPPEDSDEGFKSSFFDIESMSIAALFGLILLVSCLRK